MISAVTSILTAPGRRYHPARDLNEGSSMEEHYRNYRISSSRPRLLFTP